MKFTQWVQSHHRSILFLLFAFAFAGLASSLALPVSLFPKMDFPRVVVNLDAGDRPADRMVIEVTWPVEEAVRAVPGVRTVRSISSRGSADVSVNFDWGGDMVASTLQIESAVSQIRNQLPAGTNFEVRRMDPTVFPVLGYSLTSDTHSLVELRDLAMYQMRPVLSAVSGVGRVEVQGGEQREYQILLDPAKLDSFGLSLDDVARASSASNVIDAVGWLEEHNKLYLIVSNTQFADFEQIGKTILRSGQDGTVCLEDVATVQKATVPQYTRVTADGHDAVLLQIYQQPAGNTVQIAKDIKAQLQVLEKRIPTDVRVANWYDQSQLIVSSAGSVRDALILGVVLAAVILLLFLRNLKVTLIAAMTVPMVLASTALLLYVLSMSFNIMTLGGMAAAVGLIIDDAIVMIEHVIRRLRAGGGHYRGSVMNAAAEFTRPLAGSSLSTTIIFAPLAFLSGVTGAFFKALSLTMAASLVISFLIAWLAVPILSLHLLRQKDADQKEGGPVSDWVNRTYGRLMMRVLSRPWLMGLVLVPLLAVGWYAFKHTGSGFMPPMDEGGFVLDYRSAPGTSLDETDRLLRQVGEILRGTPEVQTYSRRTGLQLGGGITEANEGDFFVRLEPLPRRSIEEVMDEVRRKTEHGVPGLEIELLQLMEDLIGDLTAVPQPIEIKLFSDDEGLLQKLGPEVAQAIANVPGVVDVKDGIVLAGDALDIRVDRQKASLEGLSAESVTTMLNDYLTGTVTTEVQKGPQMIGVRAWIPLSDRATSRQVERLRLRAPDGHLVPLKRIARIQAVSGQPQITREDLKQMVAVTGRIAGRDMGSTVRDVIRVLDKPGLLPKGVYYRLGGLYQQQRVAFRGLVIVLAAAVALLFVLLLFLYESFRVALAMMLTTLLAMASVFIGLWLTGTELNITAMMGMTMVVGIVTEVGIIYYSEYHELPEGTAASEGLILAGKNRMRPIAMSTLAAILALTPLALGIGQGAAMQRPLAIAIISGLAVQLFLVLTVLPTLLSVLSTGERDGSSIEERINEDFHS
jgi:CzcA family heavy metal efflux pump